MEPDMKTEEDEAFDDLARRQGMWGGGFPAKRAMAADKLQKVWSDYVVDCNYCGAEQRIERGNHHPWCACGSDDFDWGNERLVVPEKEPVQDWKTLPKKDAPLVEWAKEQTPSAAQPAQDVDYWIREATAARQAEMAMRRELEAQPAQEPPSEWAGIKAILDEYGLQAIDFVADFKAALARSPQQEAIYGMNQDDWKDVVAAITKVRDGRGVYLACRPADVFQEWFLALGTAKVKEKNT
jgi:hypothetical protein